MGSGCCCCKAEPPPKSEPDRHKTPYIKREPENIFIPTKTPLPVVTRNPLIHRCANATIKTTNPKKFIDAYHSEQLTSLEEALEPFGDSIDQLFEKIQEAKDNCSPSSEHGLTHDESAAVYIYTMHWDEHCVYDRLKEAWESGNKSAIEKWFKYLKLLDSALQKLPSEEIEVWQGTPYDDYLLEYLNSKSPQIYSSIGLSLPEPRDIDDYLRQDCDKGRIIFGYYSVGAKLLDGYAATREKVYAILPGTKLAVSPSNSMDDDGCLVYHFTQIPPDVEKPKQEQQPKFETPKPVTPKPIPQPKPEPHFHCCSRSHFVHLPCNLLFYCRMKYGILDSTSSSNKVFVDIKTVLKSNHLL